MRMAIGALCFGFVAFFVGARAKKANGFPAPLRLRSASSHAARGRATNAVVVSSWRVMSWGSCSDLRGDNAPRIDASWTVPDASVLDTPEGLDVGVSDTFTDDAR